MELQVHAWNPSTQKTCHMLEVILGHQSVRLCLKKSKGRCWQEIAQKFKNKYPSLVPGIHIKQFASDYNFCSRESDAPFWTEPI